MAKKLKQASRKELQELKPYLEEWVDRTEKSEYIDEDPVQFMHAYEDKEDQLLAGFFAALMAWGRRDIVVNKVGDLLNRMDHRPADFIKNFTEADAARFEGFKHRTFKPVDIYWLTKILSSIENKYAGFENFWKHCYSHAENKSRELISVFHEEFFAMHPEAAQRTRKHISDSEKNSSCKRLYLFLKWSIREGSPVDLGIMDFMPASELMIPMDVHVGRQARVLGMLGRTYNDWKAVEELTGKLRQLDPEDPSKYDFALFGIGLSDEEIPERFVKNPEYLG
ncbi:TIGR02757 family protein [Balneolaceae bacterium YR4-1]|uniref:TIGR02757 family protein n=1 Tax=Halalkalibaculum roseum TaxID=2709311 RepID=A0A6M1T588_9BACT|nr:TIGR02757 family protein [Halalkalibaculum roseum]